MLETFQSNQKINKTVTTSYCVLFVTGKNFKLKMLDIFKSSGVSNSQRLKITCAMIRYNKKNRYMT